MITASDAGERVALDAILTLINGGTGDASGDFAVRTTAGTVLAAMPFSAVAFQASTTDGSGYASANSNAVTSAASPTAGTIANGQFRDKANGVVVAFTITAIGGGGDVEVADVVIPAGTTAISCSGVTMKLYLG